VAYHFLGGRAQFFDNSGDPLASGKVYFYAAGGTTTPKNTWPTQAGTPTPNANPVVLDSAGRAEIWLGEGAYRVIVKTSAGATLTDTDNVRAIEGALTDATDANGGAGLIPYSPTLAYPAGSLGAKLQSMWASVTDYGAVGDASDEHVEIQAAIDAVNTAGGGVVWFPKPVSEYHIGTVGLVAYQNVRLVGEVTRYAGATARGVTISYDGTGGYAISGENLLDATIENLDIDCTAAAGPDLVGIYLNGAWKCTLRNVTVRGASADKGYSILIDTNAGTWGGQHNYLEQIETADGVIRIAGTSASDGVTTTVINTCRGYQYDFVHSQVTLINVTAEAWTNGSGFNFDGAGCYVTMLGCDVELQPVAAGSFVVGQGYQIVTTGTTDFTGVGAANSTPGTSFTATGAGTGTGTAVLSSSAITISNNATVREFGTVWAGFAGPSRLNGDMATLRSYGGRYEYVGAYSADTAEVVEDIGDNTVARYVSREMYPVDPIGGQQDGYYRWKRRVAGTEVLTHEYRWHAIRHHTRTNINNAASTVLTVTLPTGGGVCVRAMAWGVEAAIKATCMYDFVAINDGGTVQTPVRGNGLESPTTGMVFTGAVSGANFLIQFEHGSATPSTVNFVFEILGQFSAIATAGS
jgi:hypothetical protein